MGKAILIRGDEAVDVEALARDLDHDPRLAVDVIGWPPAPDEIAALADNPT